MSNAANVMMAKDAWSRACNVQAAAEAAMDADMTVENCRAVAAARKAQAKAWAVWNRAEAA